MIHHFGPDAVAGQKSHHEAAAVFRFGGGKVRGADTARVFVFDIVLSTVQTADLLRNLKCEHVDIQIADLLFAVKRTVGIGVVA